MRKILFILLIFNVLQINAQTNVLQVGKGTLPQNYISYFLPQTEIVVEVNVKRTIQKSGRFANFAKRLLALNNVITSNSEKYELESVNISYNILPDTLKNFAVEINAKTTAYNLHLSPNRIIKGVNVASTSLNAQEGDRKGTPLQASPDTTLLFDYSLLSEDALMATSEARMAEFAARQIFKIRESRMEILSGEGIIEILSGESEKEINVSALQVVLNELDKMEKELVALFEGKSITFTETKTFRIIPKTAMENEVIFRFSQLLGIVEKDDLAGRPITMSVLPQNDNLNLNEQEKKVKKFGIFYNVSSSAQVAIFDGNKTLAENNLLFSQFGTLNFLPAELFNNKNTQVIFTESGDIEFIGAY